MGRTRDRPGRDLAGPRRRHAQRDRDPGLVRPGVARRRRCRRVPAPDGGPPPGGRPRRGHPRLGGARRARARQGRPAPGLRRVQRPAARLLRGGGLRAPRRRHGRRSPRPAAGHGPGHACQPLRTRTSVIPNGPGRLPARHPALPAGDCGSAPRPVAAKAAGRSGFNRVEGTFGRGRLVDHRQRRLRPDRRLRLVDPGGRVMHGQRDLHADRGGHPHRNPDSQRRGEMACRAIRSGWSPPTARRPTTSATCKPCPECGSRSAARGGQARLSCCPATIPSPGRGRCRTRGTRPSAG